MVLVISLVKAAIKPRVRLDIVSHQAGRFHRFDGRCHRRWKHLPSIWDLIGRFVLLLFQVNSHIFFANRLVHAGGELGIADWPVMRAAVAEPLLPPKNHRGIVFPLLATSKEHSRQPMRIVVGFPWHPRRRFLVCRYWLERIGQREEVGPCVTFDDPIADVLAMRRNNWIGQHHVFARCGHACDRG